MICPKPLTGFPVAVKKKKQIKKMFENHTHNLALAKVANHDKRCLSCGTPAITGRQRYCSAECRQRLQFKLDLRTGLIQALNAPLCDLLLFR